MATIKIFRSEAERNTPQTQALGLRAPDLGIVGRAISQAGTTVFNIGEERAKIGAAAQATAAHSSYRNQLLEVERASRGMQPEKAEAYYLQHSKNAYDKANNSLPSTYAKTLYATQAGQTSYTSRFKFYKEHDARLVSSAVATAELKTSSYADITGDLALSPGDRLKAATSAINEFAHLEETGAITTEKSVKLQRAWSGATLERILRSHMLGAEGKKGGAVAIIQKFKAGELDDEVANKLALAVDDDELTKIEIRMHKEAHRIETHKRQEADRNNKLANRGIALDTGRLYSANDLKTARFHYDRLISEGGFDTLAKIENAQEWLGTLGDSEFAEKADEVSFRTSTQGSKEEALTTLYSDDLNNTMTTAKVLAQKRNLTEPVFRTMMQKVITEHSDGLVKAKRIMASKFKFTENMNEGDSFEKEQSRAAYFRTVNKLENWETGNKGATYDDVVAHGNKLVAEEMDILVNDLRGEFVRNLLVRKDWGAVLAPIPNKPDIMNAMERAKRYVSANGNNELKRKQALRVMKTLKEMHDFKVDLTIPPGN